MKKLGCWIRGRSGFIVKNPNEAKWRSIWYMSPTEYATDRAFGWSYSLVLK